MLEVWEKKKCKQKTRLYDWEERIVSSLVVNILSRQRTELWRISTETLYVALKCKLIFKIIINDKNGNNGNYERQRLGSIVNKEQSQNIKNKK